MKLIGTPSISTVTRRDHADSNSTPRPQEHLAAEEVTTMAFGSAPMSTCAPCARGVPVALATFSQALPSSVTYSAGIG